MDTDPANTGRDQGGRFAPGWSGNPAGPPKGTSHRATRAAQALLNGEAEVLTRKAVDLALAGDVTALRLCIERLVPPCREARVHLPVPALESAADLPRILAFLLALAAGGAVTPGEAEKLARLTGEYAKAVELAEIEERLRRLEEAAANRGSTDGRQDA